MYHDRQPVSGMPTSALPVAVDAWSCISSSLRAMLGSAVHDAWFQAMRLDGDDGGVAVFSVPTVFLRSWTTTHYEAHLLAAAREWNPDVFAVTVTLRGRGLPYPRTLSPEPQPERVVRRLPPPWSGTAAGSPLSHGSTFDAFVISTANAEAVTLLRPNGQGRVGVFVLEGEAGCGKTHLAQAIARGEAAFGRRSVYLTRKGAIAAVMAGTHMALADAHSVILDDAHLMGERTAAALASAIDPKRQSLTLITVPGRTSSIMDMTVPVAGKASIGPLDGKDVVRLVEALGGERASTIVELLPGHPEVAPMAAGVAVSLYHRLAAGMEAIPTDPVRKSIRVEDIQKICAEHWNMPVRDMLSTRRTAKVVMPRQVAMYLSKEMTQQSLPEIGRRFGGRDHTTVLHAVRKMSNLRRSDAGFASIVEGLLAAITG